MRGTGKLIRIITLQYRDSQLDCKLYSHTAKMSYSQWFKSQKNCKGSIALFYLAEAGVLLILEFINIKLKTMEIVIFGTACCKHVSKQTSIKNWFVNTSVPFTAKRKYPSCQKSIPSTFYLNLEAYVNSFFPTCLFMYNM